MMNGFKHLVANWAFFASIDALGTHFFLYRQPIDTCPPSKDFNLSRKVEEPQSLPEGLERVPLGATNIIIFFNQAMGHMVSTLHSELTTAVPHPN